KNQTVCNNVALFHGNVCAYYVHKTEALQYQYEFGAILGDLLGRARSQPMVLAIVSEAVPTLKASSSYPVIAEDFIAGNPDVSSNRDLQTAGWEVVRPRFASNDDAAFERFADVSGTGLG